jgi:hypothetical protein
MDVIVLDSDWRKPDIQSRCSKRYREASSNGLREPKDNPVTTEELCG